MHTTTQPATNTVKSVNILDNRPVIRSSRSVYDVINQYWNRDRIEMDEETIALFLNQGNCVIQLYPLMGGVPQATGPRISMILQEALKVGTCSIILMHMHPPEYTSKQKTIQAFAKKIKDAAGLFDISLYDYMVICDAHHGYISFADAGML
jgi:DNA repair protein RadC